MNGNTKTLLDATAVITAIGTMLNWMPQVAALFTVVWLAIRIWETDTVKRWFKRE